VNDVICGGEMRKDEPVSAQVETALHFDLVGAAHAHERCATVALACEDVRQQLAVVVGAVLAIQNLKIESALGENLGQHRLKAKNGTSGVKVRM
jgi:hypothetical protein